VQRAYRDIHGKLPIYHGVDVLDVDGLTAKRYLDIAVPLKKRTAVINDNEAAKPRRKAGLTPTSGLDHEFSAAAMRNISIACGR
jgi:hypothetical protein